jgi:hypothetical protein
MWAPTKCATKWASVFVFPEQMAKASASAAERNHLARAIQRLYPVGDEGAAIGADRLKTTAIVEI